MPSIDDVEIASMNEGHVDKKLFNFTSTFPILSQCLG